MTADWQEWIGRRETRTEILELESLRRYALAIDADADVARTMPPLGHWAFFLPGPADADIGPDGHPRRGGFLPDIPLPRRMFAASDIAFAAPLLMGEEATLASTIASVTAKSGRSGELVFVEVDRVIHQRGVDRVIERQSYVYRGDGERVPAPVPTGTIEGEAWRPDAVNLFRFSAATFNGHRIHYDLPYAREVEGYPGLIVHGPFTAARLAALAERRGPLTRFAFRAQAPLFLGEAIGLSQEGATARAIRCDGATAMVATVEYAPAEARADDATHG